jgi:large subunit ribosomal protein L9
MKVILTEDVKDLGLMGHIVEVKNGYGRNYLIPKNLAVEANPKNINHFEHQKNIILAKVKKIRNSAEDIAEQISKMNLSIEAVAGEEDKLFGSVTSKDIAEEISKQGVEVDKRKVLLDEPIKRLGSYEVTVKLHQDVTANVKVEVIRSVKEDA